MAYHHPRQVVMSWLHIEKRRWWWRWSTVSWRHENHDRRPIERIIILYQASFACSIFFKFKIKKIFTILHKSAHFRWIFSKLSSRHIYNIILKCINFIVPMIVHNGKEEAREIMLKETKKNSTWLDFWWSCHREQWAWGKGLSQNSFGLQSDPHITASSKRSTENRHK